MYLRQTERIRDTNETKIKLTLNLDGSGIYKNNSGCGFLDHMLDLFARHGRFDLEVFCKGDTHIDYHHTVEDIGIALGQAFSTCLGDMRGIKRYGSIILPMDEVLMITAVDISGRATLGYQVTFQNDKVGDFDVPLVEEFMLSMARNMNATIHFNQLAGGNTHHVIEAMFKGLGRALAQAVSIDQNYSNEIPSTKGIL